MQTMMASVGHKTDVTDTGDAPRKGVVVQRCEIVTYQEKGADILNLGYLNLRKYVLLHFN